MKLRSTVNVHMTATSSCNELHFDRRLPWLRLPPVRSSALHEPSLIVRSPANRRAASAYLARCNAGQNHFEIGNPVEKFQEILEALNRIEGLISLHQENSYTIEFQAAKLFNAIAIGQSLAQLFTVSIFECPPRLTVAVELTTGAIGRHGANVRFAASPNNRIS
jgi:hypothetical protein